MTILSGYAQNITLDTAYIYKYWHTTGEYERFFEWGKNNPNEKILLKEEDKNKVEEIINRCKLKSYRLKMGSTHYVFNFIINNKSYYFFYSGSWFYNLTLGEKNEFYLIKNDKDKEWLKDFIKKIKGS